MTRGLRRIYAPPHLHYITCSCDQRTALLGSAQGRDIFVRILEEVRSRYRFLVIGYVVMPEHFHLLMSKPDTGDPSRVMQVLKQRVARQLLPPRERCAAGHMGLCEAEPNGKRRFWQPRFYDFNVWSEKKRIEKLRYMHRNPVKRGLVERPDLWKWSSFRFYAYGEEGAVKVQRVGDRAAGAGK
jgi:putative transposase